MVLQFEQLEEECYFILHEQSYDCLNQLLTSMNLNNCSSCNLFGRACLIVLYFPDYKNYLFFVTKNVKLKVGITFSIIEQINMGRLSNCSDFESTCIIVCYYGEM